MKLPDLNLITEVLFRGEEIAQLKGLENNTPICVLIALLEEKDSYAVKVLQRFGCDVEKLHDNLFNSIKQENRKFETRFLDPGTNLLLKTSRELTLSKKEKSVSHITLLETFLIRGFGLDEFWKQVNVNTEELIKYISEDKSDNHPHKSPRPFEAPVDPFIHDTDDLFDPFDEDLPPHERDVRARRNKKRRRAIDTFSVDLVSLAKNNKLDPCVGRDAETERLIQILARKNKNNACLLGEAGVGKTAIVEGLAQRIAQNNVPDMLKGVHIYSLDLGSLIAGTRFRGDFEERLKSIMQDIKKMGDKAIVFLDEIHTVMGAGSTGGNDLDASNILKPALSKGEFRLIGATTPKEYRNSIEKDPAFERRIQTIAIKEPTKAETLKILEGIVHGFEAFHNVTVNHSTLKLCVDLSDMYITDKYQPDKSIDVLDEACAKAKLKFKSQVTDKDIYSTVETMTGIPMSKLTQTENEKLLSLEREFKKRIVGQEKAIDVLCKTIRRNRVGLRDSSRPIGSFIFLGPTGVGKTELAKTLAQVLFGSDKNIIRFDMSEYMEKHTVSRLIGAAPGYIGYEEGGQLTELVKRRPYSVILFDEIEKAHNDVYNVLLQVLDDGRLTDNVGRVVDFKNTIIIFTGNIGSGYISNNDKVGFISSKDDMEKAIKTNINQGVKNTFKPEFLNRIDDLIIFDSLTEEDCKKIVKLMLSDLLKSLSEKNIKVTVSEGACDFLAKKGTSRQFGARPLRKTIQKYIEDPLSEEILNNKLVSGKTLNISLSKDKIVFKYKENKKLVMNNA